ncbi:16S rRNA (cytidine(1402)-2'-O)-methyltransferase [Nevskia soli]|uniref:16S rRNA (cytidine(1402)-2'-O)-methyltransferase n=1 Tax=Nevskia soli TaxID=418856 RepID=UPI0009FD40E3|nr:16S rRNA (cytidine(1402)-2'-O)-methyltransferase [Nevskia soli]
MTTERSAAAPAPPEDVDHTVVAGALYVVATPIGNLGDLSPRACRILAGVDRIAAEDTRTSGLLLAHFGIQRPLVALHEHNEDRIAAELVRQLQAGQSLALISDAGTPLISDPGFALVRAARAAGVPAYAVPGPCAAVAALSVSGLPSDAFLFAGFLPPKQAARRAKLEQLGREPRTVIVYESSHRIADTLADLAAVLGPQRPVALSRELSKRFEESYSGTAAGLQAWQAADANRGRGEFVLLIGSAGQTADLAEGERVLRLLLRELPPSGAARLAAEITGAPRKALYAVALRLAGENGENKDNGDPD